MRYLLLILILVFCCEARYIPLDGIYSLPDQMPQYLPNVSSFERKIFDQIDTVGLPPNSKVYLSFIVNVEGTLDSVKIVKGINAEIDRQIIRSVENSTDKWIPGSSNNQPVNVRMVYVLNF